MPTRMLVAFLEGCEVLTPVLDSEVAEILTLQPRRFGGTEPLAFDASNRLEIGVSPRCINLFMNSAFRKP